MTTVLLPSADLPSTNPERDCAAALAASRATAFIRGQATWLQRGLERGGDATVVDLIVSAHDRSHDRWVAVIASANRAIGTDAATALIDVYTSVGRVVGSLDRGALDLLDAGVADQVRQLLATRLREFTESTVETIWSLAAEV